MNSLGIRSQIHRAVLRLAKASSAASILALAACGGGGSSGAAGPAGATGTDGVTTLALASAQSAGLVCPTGGTKIEAGLDANASGTLDASEVGSTQYVCNSATGTAGATGTTGATGLTSLILMTAEPAGSTCAYGGSKISVGIDSNSSGALDSSEVTSTGYVCQGATGTAGAVGPAAATGAAGMNSLLAIVAEPAGSNCLGGGSRVTAGVDANGDGNLGTSEVTSASYICNALSSGALTWTDVTAASFQTASNNGYLADSASKVVFTLPASPVVGDVVRFAGIGAGAWSIAQNAGQFIKTRNLPGNFAFLPAERSRSWYSVTASADGTKLYAGVSGGSVYASADSGLTWSVTAAPSAYWRALATSADGQQLIAGNGNNGFLYTSADAGATWTTHGAVAGQWNGAASSSDGVTLAAANGNGQIYVSTDSGVTFTPHGPAAYWSSVAMSADGVHMIASNSNNGFLYTSADSGQTWTPGVQQGYWQGVASSSDGSHLAAVDSNNQSLWLSGDSGLTWTQASVGGSFSKVAMSADGTRIMTGSQYNGLLYISTDSGANWASHGSNQQWNSFAISSDASKLVAVGWSTQIFVSTNLGDTTTVGVAGSVTGGQNDALELQYAGGGAFIVLSSSAGMFSVK
ncbi:MAG: sialidase family protein [Burkholderiales bacterium]